MSAETAMKSWKDVRNGLIEEVEKIPDDQMEFRATPDTRSVAELLQHVVETQKILVGETCREESNLTRQSFVAHAQEYAPGVRDVADKQGLIELHLREIHEEHREAEDHHGRDVHTAGRRQLRHQWTRGEVDIQWSPQSSLSIDQSTWSMYSPPRRIDRRSTPS